MSRPRPRGLLVGAILALAFIWHCEANAPPVQISEPQNQIPLYIHNDGMRFLVDVNIGSRGQPLRLVLDTANSDAFLFDNSVCKGSGLMPASTCFNVSASSSYGADILTLISFLLVCVNTSSVIRQSGLGHGTMCCTICVLVCTAQPYAVADWDQNNNFHSVVFTKSNKSLSSPDLFGTVCLSCFVS
jgi:hypothetical protein